MSEGKSWKDTPGVLPQFQVLVQHQQMTGNLKFLDGLSWFQQYFHPFHMFPGQSSAYYLVKKMRLCSHTFFTPSCSSISFHFPKVVSTRIFTMNIDFPNQQMNRWSTVIAMFFCCITRNPYWKFCLTPHIWGPVQHKTKRWPLLLGMYSVK